MNDINLTILTGRLVKDPELKNTSSGKAFTKISIAVNKNAFNPTTKNFETKAIFVDCIAYEKIADFIAKYARKGSRVIIQGESNFAEYTSKEGKKHKSYLVNIKTINFIDTKKDDEPEEEVNPTDVFVEESKPQADISVPESELPW